MDTIASICAAVAVIGICCASYLYITRIRKGDESIRPLSSFCLVVGFFAQTFYMGAKTVGSSFACTQNYVMMAMWLLTFAYCIFEVIIKKRTYGAYVLPLIAAGMIVAHFL